MQSMPWDEWEDYAAGFYNPGVPTEMHVANSVELLTAPERFFAAAIEMVNHWETSAIHNLYYMWTGRNAWIGQASCLYAHGSPPADTRRAWGRLTQGQQDTANGVAVAVRKDWEGRRDGRETLFGS